MNCEIFEYISNLREILRKCEVFCVLFCGNTYVFVIPREIAIVYCSYLVGNIAARCEVFFQNIKNISLGYETLS